MACWLFPACLEIYCSVVTIHGFHPHLRSICLWDSSWNVYLIASCGRNCKTKNNTNCFFLSGEYFPHLIDLMLKMNFKRKGKICYKWCISLLWIHGYHYELDGSVFQKMLIPHSWWKNRQLLFSRSQLFIQAPESEAYTRVIFLFTAWSC